MHAPSTSPNSSAFDAPRPAASDLSSRPEEDAVDYDDDDDDDDDQVKSLLLLPRLKKKEISLHYIFFQLTFFFLFDSLHWKKEGKKVMS